MSRRYRRYRNQRRYFRSSRSGYWFMRAKWAESVLEEIMYSLKEALEAEDKEKIIKDVIARIETYFMKVKGGRRNESG